jgi:hypothetical protein
MDKRKRPMEINGKAGCKCKVKLKSVFTILFSLLAIVAIAQSKKIRQVLSNSEMVIHAVFGSKDSTMLEKLFAKELVYEHSSGKVENREQAIFGILHNQSKYEEDILPTPMNVIEKGDSVVTKKVFKAVEKKADGTTGQLNLIIEMVWIKEGGEWKLARRKATKNNQ